MTHRIILDLTKFDFENIFDLELGEVLSVTVSTVPGKYLDRFYVSTKICPVCGREAKRESNRICVSAHPVYSKIPNLSFMAFAHNNCFEICPLADAPPPIP